MTDGTNSALEASIDRFYKSYSAKRVAFAALLLGFAAIGSAWLVYALTHSALFSILAFGLVGFLLANLALLVVIPPTKKLEKSKQLLMGAARDRSRIKSIEKHKVTLLDHTNKAHVLKGADMDVWESIIVPNFLKNGIGAEQPKARKARTLTASERRYIDEQKKLILEREKAMADEQKQIAEERARIEAERESLKSRDKELNDAEEVVISRLNEVEVVQAELEQLRENLDIQAGTLDGSRNAAGNKLLKEREAELKAKENELEVLKKQLQEDQKIVLRQKTDLNQLKGEILRSGATDNDSDDPEAISQRQTLEERLRQLEEENKLLEAQARDMEEAENTLIERMNKLSAREASVEQSEVNAGLRSD